MAIATSKSALEAQIRNLKQTFFLGLAAHKLLGLNEVIEHLNNPPFNQIIENWTLHPERRSIEREEFLKMLLRSILKEPFETIKSYCNDTNQIHLFKSQSWYEFARLIRNVVSHDYRFNFSDFDKSDRLPLKWNDKTLVSNMDGQEMTLKFFAPDDVLRLVEDMQTFVNSSELQ